MCISISISNHVVNRCSLILLLRLREVKISRSHRYRSESRCELRCYDPRPELTLWFHQATLLSSLAGWGNGRQEGKGLVGIDRSEPEMADPRRKTSWRQKGERGPVLEHGGWGRGVGWEGVTVLLLSWRIAKLLREEWWRGRCGYALLWSSSRQRCTGKVWLRVSCTLLL